MLALWQADGVASGVAAGHEAHERAARLGLAGRLGVTLRVRVGVALGPVITGPVGGQPSAYGLPVNLARRLCDAAEPGETLTCGEVAASLGFPAHLRSRLLPPLAGFGTDCRAYGVREVVAGGMKTG